MFLHGKQHLLFILIVFTGILLLPALLKVSGLVSSVINNLSSSKSNIQSALSNLAVINKYLTKEKDASRFIGPLSPGVDVHLSHFWVIPKGHTTGKWRVITDLSYPLESSINDSIDKELCSLKYVTVDIVARMVAMLGPASFMA